MTDTLGRPNTHRRKRSREEREKAYVEAHKLFKEGWKTHQIAKALRMDARTAKEILEGRAVQWKPEAVSESGEYIPTAPRKRYYKKLDHSVPGQPLPELTPEPIPEAPPTEKESVVFLRTARDNPKLAWADRIKCALAVAKLESGEAGEAWTPPEDASLWAEALADAILAQTPNVVGRVSEVVRERLGKAEV